MAVTKENLHSEILPNLYISGTLDGDVLENPMRYTDLMGPCPFDSVVTLYGHARPYGYYVREQRFGIADAEIDPLSVPEILQLADWLHSEWKLRNKVVAARCQMGWNRSGLIIALVLLKEGYSTDEAISLIRERRSPNALCNPHFVKFIEERAKVLQLEELAS
jgi:hypothetical protein